NKTSMKKQKKKNKKLKVGTFRELTRTRSCFGTITKCRVIGNEKKTELELTIKVMPKHVRFYESIRFPNDVSQFDYLQDVFRVTLEKKYRPGEEIQHVDFFTDMFCSLRPCYSDERKLLCTLIDTPISSLQGGEFTGYEISSKNRVPFESKKKK
ncbi:MAG: hypothetical protein V1896_02640, partial [Candidatus Zambryskibacteria bacterium]